jgi:hypothetical protein
MLVSSVILAKITKFFCIFATYMEKMVIANDEFFVPVRQMLEEGHSVTIPVKGFSMLPFIRGERDLVVLEPVGEVRPDDIVLFHIGPEKGGRYVMHRVLSVAGDRVEIQGDGVPVNRERVLRSQIFGKAVSILRDGEKAVDPYSPRELRKVHLWQALRPVRRYLLFIYRNLPWNRRWLKPQYAEALKQYED